MTVLNKYPQYNSLKGLVTDKIIKREISRSALIFEKYYPLAQKKITKVNLADIFPKKLEKQSIILENFLGHWGNISIESVCKIALIVKFFRPKNIFEFGTYNGLTTLQIAINSPKSSKIYTLDIGSKKAELGKYKLSVIDLALSKDFMRIFRTGVGSYFKNHKQSVKIRQIIHDSATYDFSPFFNKMDLIFIDGAHDYANKKSDSENALKMLRKNGIILWDNYADVGNPDVTKYLYELSLKYHLYHLRGTSLVVYKQ